MKKINSWYLPDKEKHFLNYFREIDSNEYQKPQRDKSLSYIENCRIAIDIGANVGFWARDLCKIFKKVILFEPHFQNVECLKKNLEEFKNFKIEECGLSNYKGSGELFYDESGLGNSTLYKDTKLNKKLMINVMKLDDFYLNEIDYIKIDVQYHELEVIKGAINTLKNNNPVLCIESARRTKEEIIYVNKFLEILKKFNYEIVGKKGKEIFLKKN